MTQAARFRELLRRDGMVVAPGAYDCITARLIERAGFNAVYMTGAGWHLVTASSASICSQIPTTFLIRRPGRIASL